MHRSLIILYKYSFLPGFVCLIIFLSFNSLTAFSQTKKDTLEMAKQYISKGDTKQSIVLLNTYRQTHSHDLNTVWLYAQAAYLNHDFKLCRTLYDNTLEMFPANFYLKLDYANKLIEMKEFNKADSVLKSYEKYDSTSTGLNFTLAKKNYYEGDYKASTAEIKNVLKQDGSNIAAYSLLKDIYEANATWLKIGAGYQSDDQPLQSITPQISAGTYLSKTFSPFVNYSAPLFTRDDQHFTAQLLQAGNVFHFFKADLLIKASGGVVEFPSNNQYAWTGDLLLDKIFARHLELNAEVSHQPYFATRTSLDTNVLAYNYSLSIGWNNTDSWNGKISFNNSYFNIYNNNVYSLSGWIYAPPLRFSDFKMRIGYSFNYSDANKNLYTGEPIEDSFAIKGFYDPYFTPNEQIINSLLASIDYKIKNFEAGIHANAGVYAENMNPYLFFNTLDNGETFIQKGFAKTDFSPLQIDAYGLIHLNENILLGLNYSYTHNIFYTSNYAGISLKINFVHE
jgi:hypothetical protein